MGKAEASERALSQAAETWALKEKGHQVRARGVGLRGGGGASGGKVGEGHGVERWGRDCADDLV